MGRDPKTGKRTPPSRPREVVREELLKDPNTKKIAASVKMELEKYVELVLDYAYNPDKEVVLNVIPDEALRDAGYDPHSPESVGKWIKGAAQKIAGKIAATKATRSGFEKEKEPSVLDVPAVPTEEDTAEGAVTPREDLLKDIKKNRGPKA